MADSLPVLLDETAVAAALGVSVATLNRLIENGDFVPPVPVSLQGRMWLDRDVTAYLHLKSRGQKFVGGKPEKPEKAPEK